MLKTCCDRVVKQFSFLKTKHCLTNFLASLETINKLDSKWLGLKFKLWSSDFELRPFNGLTHKTHPDPAGSSRLRICRLSKAGPSLCFPLHLRPPSNLFSPKIFATSHCQLNWFKSIKVFLVDNRFLNQFDTINLKKKDTYTEGRTERETRIWRTWLQSKIAVAWKLEN